MRLVVISPDRSDGKWAAQECRRQILTSVGYSLSGYQIFVFYPEVRESIREYIPTPGDHIFYVDGWDSHEEFAQVWHEHIEQTQGLWSVYERKAPVPHE